MVTYLYDFLVQRKWSKSKEDNKYYVNVFLVLVLALITFYEKFIALCFFAKVVHTLGIWLNKAMKSLSRILKNIINKFKVITLGKLKQKYFLLHFLRVIIIVHLKELLQTVTRTPD